MKKSKVLMGAALTALGLFATGCSDEGAVLNQDKPLIFFNRQPSNPETGEIDMDTMNFSDQTYYVGFDAAGGGAVQGDLITDYLASKTKAELDKNGDGILGYCLYIGDIGHNDSKARTQGIREALGTWDGSTDPSTRKEGNVTVADGTLKVVELDAKEMKSDAGATWDATAATAATGTWFSQFGNEIDFLVSNNDGMAMGALKSSSFAKGTPIFGYDANADALEAVKAGTLTGTVSQNVDAQAIGTLQLIRNMLDGVTGEDVVKKGISEKDQYGNQVSAEMEYVAETKALLALNSGINKDNVDKYLNTRDAGIKQVNGEEKKVLLTLYNAGDNFLSSSYKPALEYYAKLLNIKLTIVEGDGQSESTCLDKFTNLDQYDAYAVNMVKTNSGQDYLRKLKA